MPQALSTTAMLERLAAVKERIARAARACGRDPDQITLVAVSKRHPAANIAALADAGHKDFGESYIQEALAKQEELAGYDINWHFIGHLQRNKAKQAAGRFTLIHGVDKLELAKQLSKRALEQELEQELLIQVNIHGEEQKSGVNEQELSSLLREVTTLPNLRVTGLMTMPRFCPDPEESRSCFARLRELRDELEQELGLALPRLSMGMSNDFAQAVEEGATLVRVGTDIFGERPALR